MAPPPVVVLSGELDGSSALRVRDALAAVPQGGTVDLRAVRYLDASVLSEFARLARRIGTMQATLVVASPQIRRVFTLVRFDELFRIVERTGRSSRSV